jgi:hypothetical protein
LINLASAIPTSGADRSRALPVQRVAFKLPAAEVTAQPVVDDLA